MYWFSQSPHLHYACNHDPRRFLILCGEILWITFTQYLQPQSVDYYIVCSDPVDHYIWTWLAWFMVICFFFPLFVCVCFFFFSFFFVFFLLFFLELVAGIWMRQAVQPIQCLIFWGRVSSEIAHNLNSQHPCFIDCATLEYWENQSQNAVQEWGEITSGVWHHSPPPFNNWLHHNRTIPNRKS